MCIEEYTKEHSDYVRKVEDDKKNKEISQLKEENIIKDRIIAEKDRKLETILSGLVKDGILSSAEAANRAGISLNEFEKLMNTEK